LSQRLDKRTGHMVRLGLWDNDGILVTMNFFPATEDTFLFRQFGLGLRIPAYCSAVGKAILATFTQDELESYLARVRFKPHTSHTLRAPQALKENLEEARRKGYTWECEEYLNNLACIATPIHDDSGNAAAAVSLSGEREFLKHPDIEEMAGYLRQAAAEISLGMGCPASIIIGGKKD